MVLNPAELLVLGNLEETLEQLKSFYNHIVIDSPPILGATDAAIMGKHADATFLVVKEGRYTAQELEVSFRRFQQVGCKTEWLYYQRYERRVIVLPLLRLRLQPCRHGVTRTRRH